MVHIFISSGDLRKDIRKNKVKKTKKRFFGSYCLFKAQLSPLTNESARSKSRKGVKSKRKIYHKSPVPFALLTNG